MSATSYRIAGFEVEVTLPATYEAEQWLPTAEPFRVTEQAKEPLLRFRALGLTADEEARFAAAEQLSEDRNDMGIVRLKRLGEELLIEQRFLNATATNRMILNPQRSACDVAIAWREKNSREALSSLLRAAYAMAVINHGAVSIHASAISYRHEAILFLGRSGTGKSTHADLWRAYADGAVLLNDDNPTLRLEAGRLIAYGTPWSGKRGCYRNVGLPVRGIVRLSQGAENRYRALNEGEAFMALLPSCSAVLSDERMEDQLCDLLGKIAQHTRIGHLQCRPDRQAFCCCHAGLGYEEA